MCDAGGRALVPLLAQCSQEGLPREEGPFLRAFQEWSNVLGDLREVHFVKPTLNDRSPAFSGDLRATPLRLSQGVA